jgi:hypothetical protein
MKTVLQTELLASPDKKGTFLLRCNISCFSLSLPACRFNLVHRNPAVNQSTAEQGGVKMNEMGDETADSQGATHSDGYTLATQGTVGGAAGNTQVSSDGVHTSQGGGDGSPDNMNASHTDKGKERSSNQPFVQPQDSANVSLSAHESKLIDVDNKEDDDTDA